MLYWTLRCHFVRYTKNYFISRYCSRQSVGKWKIMQLVVSSLRMDAIAAKGLGIARKQIWEISLKNNCLYLNGVAVKKSKLVTTGDVVEVDYNHSDNDVVRGRVEVLSIGEKTNKGGYHVTLKRNKLYMINP